MASRRPRIKVAANLSIRRAPKTTGNGEQLKVVDIDAVPLNIKETLHSDICEPEIQLGNVILPEAAGPKIEVFPKQKDEPEELQFKLPKPVDDVPKYNLMTGAGIESPNNATNTIPNNSNEEPMSPRKQEARFGFPLPLSRKRNRTESLTSNKSLPEGIIVNKVARKVSTKQEESQRTLENKKEIRKRLTTISTMDKQHLTMFDMIYYNPINNPMEAPAISKAGSMENISRSAERTRSRSVSKSRSPTPAPGPAIAPKAQIQLTPQLKLGPNGEMILDEASLVIENEREKEMRETLASTDIVYQDEFSGNSGYYSRIRRTKDWTSEETIRFYRCLHTLGTDFSMMHTLFPNRTRRDLKLKFKKEERLNLQLVNKALQHPKQFNLDELRERFAQEDEELERKREERLMKEQQLNAEAMAKQREEKLNKKLMLRVSKNRHPKKRVTKSERALLDGAAVIPDTENEGKTDTATKSHRKKTAKPPNQETCPVTPEATESVAEPEVAHMPTTVPVACNRPTLEQTNVPETPKLKLKRSILKRLTQKENNTKPDEALPSRLVRDAGLVVKKQSDHNNPPAKQPTISAPNVTTPAPAALATSVIKLDHPDDGSYRATVDSVPTVPSSMISQLTPIEIKYDEAETDLGYLPPLPGANAPVAMQVSLDAEGTFAFENSRESLIELEPVAVVPIGGLTKDAVANARKRPRNTKHTSANTSPSSRTVCSGASFLSRVASPPPHKLESEPQTQDDESYPANSDLEECYVADEPIIHDDDDYYNAKQEHPDTMKDGYLWETCAEATAEEITITKEEVTVADHCSRDAQQDSSEHCTIGGAVSLDCAAPSWHSLQESPLVPESTELAAPVDHRRYEPPKQEGKFEQMDLTTVAGHSASAEPGNDEAAASDEEEGGGGGGSFSLEDIDINSLVLVESQDASEPNKTIYEIYVSNPDTGQLSEKPLDVPADVIENIRTILEASEGGS